LPGPILSAAPDKLIIVVKDNVYAVCHTYPLTSLAYTWYWPVDTPQK